MISCDGGNCRVQGPITISNAAAVLEQGRRLLTAERVILDLSEVTEVDSAAVSLLLEWRRAARREKRAIQFVNLPDNLKSLAGLYGVSELLGEG